MEFCHVNYSIVFTPCSGTGVHTDTVVPWLRYSWSIDGEFAAGDAVPLRFMIALAPGVSDQHINHPMTFAFSVGGEYSHTVRTRALSENWQMVTQFTTAHDLRFKQDTVEVKVHHCGRFDPHDVEKQRLA